MEYTSLSNGVKMPMLGYGVFQIGNAETEECVAQALHAGKSIILDHHNLGTVQFLLDRIKGQIDDASK